MYSVSADLKAALASGTKYLKIMDANQTTLVSFDNIKYISYESSCCHGDIGFGNVNAAHIRAEFSGRYDIRDEVIIVAVGAEVSGTIEYVPLGVFSVSRCDVGDYSTEIEAYDPAYYMLSGAYVPTVSSGATVYAIATDIASQCGLSLDTASVSSLTTTVNADLTGYSCREMLGYIAGLCGRNVVITRDGLIRFIWFNTTGERFTADNYYEAMYKHGGNTTVTGIICEVGSATIADIRIGPDVNPIEVINPLMTATDLTNIWTAIRNYTYPIADISVFGGVLFEPGDIISVTDVNNNTASVPVMQVILYLDGGCRGQFTSFGKSVTEGSHDYRSPTQTALDAIKNGLEDAQETAESAQEAAEEAQSSIENLEIGGTNLITGTDLFAGPAGTSASGGQWGDGTWRKTGSGRETTVARSAISDPPNGNLARQWDLTCGTSAGTSYTGGIVIAQNAVPITAGQTYTMSCWAKGTGTLIMAYGLSSRGPADNSGKIAIDDAAWTRYSVTFDANTAAAYVENGKTNIFFGANGTGSEIHICGMKLERGNKVTDWTPAPEDAQRQIDAANAAAAVMAGQITGINEDIVAIQAELDGQITAWYYEGAPTLQNEPAVHWTTAQLKTEHEGDTYTDIDTGYSYRFVYKNSVWQWVQIADSAATQALAAAQEAKDIADGKRRVFVAQPSPPYDQGDLWVQGSNGDILRCQTAKAAGGSYAAADWVPASKYTDDTRADAAYAAAGKAVYGLGWKVNHSRFDGGSNPEGECYYHGYDSDNNPADINGWVLWNGSTVEIPRGYGINPGSTMPYNTVIYSVYRTSDSTFHDVCMIDGAWYGNTYTHSANPDYYYAWNPGSRAEWTWNETTDIILAQYVEPGNEQAIVNGQLYNPPKKYSELVETATIAAETAQVTANTAVDNAATAQDRADTAVINAQTAQDTADSKAEVIYADTSPVTGDYNAGDVWISPDDTTPISGDQMWTYDGDEWVQNEVGTAMIIDGCITVDKLAANSVTANKIQAGAITISKLAGSAQETLVVGTSTQTQYYLSTSASSARGGEWSNTVPTWSSGKYIWTREATTNTRADNSTYTYYSYEVYDRNLTTALSSAADAANAAAAATSAVDSANYRTQTIYRQMAAGTNSVNPYTTYWVTYDGESVVSGGTYWTTKRPTYNSNYPVLFIAVQSQSVYQYGKNPDNSVTGYVNCTTPLKDDSTTIIDGGHITTGAIDASRVAVTNLNASNITSGTIDASRITVKNLNASNITTGTLLANRIKLYEMLNVYTGSGSSTVGGKLGYGSTLGDGFNWTFSGAQLVSSGESSAVCVSEDSGVLLKGDYILMTGNPTLAYNRDFYTYSGTFATGAKAHRIPHKNGNFMIAKTLWTNSSPGSTFVAQTLSTSAGTLSEKPSDYDLIMIEYAIGTSETGLRKSETRAYAAGGKTQMSFMYDYSGAHYCYYRNATLNDSSIVFDKGYYYVTSSSSAATELNSVIIPTKVIGLRYSSS